MSMSVYQIAIFAEHADPEVQALRTTIGAKFSELGIAGSLKFLDANDVAKRDSKSPIVAVYFGLEADPPAAPAALLDLIEDACLVVPVVRSLANFSRFVPPELGGANGMELLVEDGALEQISAVLLEGLNLYRKNRRLFISYRRIETRSIAVQLYELLDGQGFDVFLDSHSIRPGEPFQEVLWHRLADTDVIVVLDSPDFSNSKWTMEEVARANSTNIQALQLIWPDKTMLESSAFSKGFSLASSDFVNAQNQTGDGALLTQVCLLRISVEVESLRARALAARQAYLVQEFCDQAKRKGMRTTPLCQ